MPKPHASVSLDLDNLWSYQKTHGDAGWERFDTYLDAVCDACLPLLAELGWKITFFVVGRDAADPRNRAAMRRLVDAGHEVGNHSYEHEPWLHRYAEDELHAELGRAEDAIEAACGQRTTLFRGPGYSCSNDLLGVLSDRGYRLDASTLPTWLGPVARWYYFRTAKLTAEQREERSRLFGTTRDARRPVKPYRWALPDGPGGPREPLPEIPVTVAPFARVPFHPSYALYLAGKSSAAAGLYWRGALAACRLGGVEPSVLLHPLDFLGIDDEPRLSFFPAMGMTGATKRDLLRRWFRSLDRAFTVLTMGEHARRLHEAGTLPLRSPDMG
ncbi:polysaccharide deacetylase family protein [Phycisphaera mikurensis]|uniref:Putative hydrolase n=1 Tax=Phycisphaera mikurensis (strain NBRC 102666 / KCTC 22515 / FYK2301M01) TaxID=1142394 RepID=I0IFJ1_PHYMF|nr:polysaccharide deacetylase family protein [Phycisphaera mikurensis]MBB6440579.1 peptidoglycan/xylan/chitin deacetylase (PgdA/CDA1 family) [Phycisphaera mikurensis]BAM04029.1 putative hydrolase [Phycisphaera mikurensis NBRC 102666]